MKLLSVAIPSYNSQDYLAHAVESLLPGGDAVEILIVDDGSKDRTAEIADDYARRYPGIVRAVHKENGGHGDAVMTGIREATGLYFKVVDSDDWVDAEAYPRVLETLRGFTEEPLDLLMCNYVYDKVGVEHKHVMGIGKAMPKGRVFGWADTGHFPKGQYLAMHSVIYRTALLRECGLNLPKHTFYVDNLYVYVPLLAVERMYYLDVSFYHYFIGREDQSVQEKVLLKRIDQQILVNKLMVDAFDPFTVEQPQKRAYLLGYLEILTTITSVMLIRSGTEENLKKKQELWDAIRENNPKVWEKLRRGVLGRILHLPGRFGRGVVSAAYTVARKVIGFN